MPSGNSDYFTLLKTPFNMFNHHDFEFHGVAVQIFFLPKLLALFTVLFFWVDMTKGVTEYRTHKIGI